MGEMMIPLPKKKYNVILADFPWPYNERNNKYTRFGLGMHIYQSMDWLEIRQFPMQSIMADDCLMFLWTTPPKLDIQISIPEIWGFQYITKAFCWIKMDKRSDKYRFGNGYYSSSNSEDCLLYRRGKVEVVSHKVSQIIHSTKPEELNSGDGKFPSDIYAHIQGHSRKPEEVKAKIVELVGDVPRIELFARGKSTYGFDVWGLEAEQ
jgi:N6-adenosine-specific RNA methylase IME4